MTGSLTVEPLEGGAVRVLTLSNPTRRNALDPGMLEALADALSPGQSAGVRAWLLRGAPGAAFCAGYDLNVLPLVEPGGPLPDQRLIEVLAALAEHPAPSVALVNGAAFGAGAELAAACDFRVGGPGASFCIPPARLGLVYALEGLARFSALVGPSRAKRLFLTAERVEAAEAYQSGLLDALLATSEEAETTALAWCRTLYEGAPLAVAGMKQGFSLLARGTPSPQARASYEGLRRAAFLSEDAGEGRAAFLEKRPPRFTGK